MNFTPHSDTGRRNDQDEDFKSRLEFDNTAYKSASEALEAYIAHFEGGRGLTTYRRRPSDLLSPAPKFYFMDSLERRLRSPPSKSPARKVDELLEWVNVAYAKELSSKVAPFGYRTTPELPGSDEENMNPHPMRAYHSHSGNDGELSTLPSPSSSVVDLNSNAGTVETEVLLSSYKGSNSSGSYSSTAAFRSAPKPGPVKSRPDGSTEYPSWVSALGKEYPSWVEDLDSSTRHRKVTQSPDKKYSSSTSSTSESGTRRQTFKRPSRSTPALKVSDLQFRRPQEPARVKMAEGRMNGVDWNDAASTDTDMLVCQSVYGPNPVNMGGDLHNSLYQDKRVARLKKESTKKLRKSTGKVKFREHSAAVSPRRSKSQTYTPTKTLRFSTRDNEQSHEYSEGKESTPVGTRVLRDSSPEGSPFTDLPSRYSVPPQNDRYGIPDEPRSRRSTSPRSSRMYVSPPALTRHSNSFAKKAEVESPPAARRQPYHVSSRPSKSPASRSSIPLKIDIPAARREDSDVESDDTDRVMRKSPTGIKMEKMYRDPSTMYPWKTMIQSSRSQDSTVQFVHSKPRYQSTPMVYASGREAEKSSAGRQPYSSGIPHGSHGSQQRIAHSDARSPHRDRLARTADNFKATPKSVFASSSYRSRDERLAKSASDARYSKPPPVPRSSARKFTHRRSKTVPDLRRIAISSATRPRHSRRSLDDDVISVNTADTESLITRPPMPVFDVSPSLTTVSDSETLVESETETEAEVSVARRHHATRVTAAQDEDDKFSPTSVFASTNPHAAAREQLPERFHLWKLDEDTKAPDSFIKRRFTSPKSGIISSFLEDCLSVDSDDPKLAKPDSAAVRLSGKEAAPGPVEALKQMLFTMQDMAHHDALDNGEYYKASSKVDFKSRDVKDSLASDDQSELRDVDAFRGEVSLQRAYHHLERLKRLVGREDDRSSVSSAN